MLTEQEIGVLQLEAKGYRQEGRKMTVAREKLDLSPIRYYQVLNLLLDRQDAAELYPMLTNRLRRLRASRQRVNSSPTL